MKESGKEKKCRERERERETGEMNARAAREIGRLNEEREWLHDGRRGWR